MKKLAIIGASYLQEPIVLKAKEMGIYTICFAWADGATCAKLCDKFYDISIIEKEEILHVCQREKIDGITTIASDTATVTVNYIASRMNLVSNPYAYSETCTNKYKMRLCFLDNNLPSPKFTLATSPEDCNINNFTLPLIVKPTDRSGSRGVEKITDIKQLPNAIHRATKDSFEHKAIIEEFIEGTEISVESISFAGKHYILQLTDKVTTGAPYFVELEHHQPSSLPDNIQQKVRQLIPIALDALHIRYGASHAELKISDNGDIHIIEIGARMGGDFIGSTLVQLSTGYDFVRGVVEVALGTFTTPTLPLNLHSGIYFLSEETKHLLPIITNPSNNPEIIKALITYQNLRKIQCSADRSGYLIYQSKNKLNLN